MNDVFMEQLVKKKNTSRELIIKVLIIISATLLSLLALSLFSVPVIGSVSLLLAVGVYYFAYIFMTSFDLEFEYIYTNGEIDIDKIIAKRKRKRIVTVKVSSFENFGQFNYHNFKNQKFDKVINAAISLDSPDTYSAEVKGKTGEKCIIIFTPSEKLLEAINQQYKKRKFIR